MKRHNMISTEKQQKNQPYHQAKLVSSIFTCQEILPPEERRKIEEAKFISSPLEKVLEKQTKKQLKII